MKSKYYQEDAGHIALDLLDFINETFDNPIKIEEHEDLFLEYVDSLFEKYMENQGYRNYN